MSETARAKFTFLPYVRQGLAAALSAPDGKTTDGRMQLPVRLRLGGGEEPAEVLSAPLQLYGPGDVVGVDPAEVIRNDPGPLTTDFDPQYFPLVEFDTPDFPWMFTPERPDAQGRLRPWLTLVVVRDREPNSLAADAARPLAVLRCELRELPDLADAWAWAHAQVSREALDGAGTEAVRAEIGRVITDAPRQNLSRLICPRRLEPNTAYIACVVPTFEAGRLAGLGETVTPQSLSSLAPAWPAPDAKNGRQLITVPVYHHWRFSTAAGSESFETLVRRLERRSELPGVGQAVLDVSAPGWNLPEAPGAKVMLEGALAPASPPPGADEAWSEAQREAFEASLLGLLNAAAAGAGDPLVTPPIYGQWHAGRGTVAAEGGGWLRDLNLDPRCRVAAGLGALVVRTQQEELVAAAWEQVEAVERANAVRRQAQLAVEVGSAIHQRLTGLAPEAFLQITEPAHGAAASGGAAARSAKAAPKSAAAQVRDSALPETALSASFRRLARRQGPIGRRFEVDPAGPVRRLAAEPLAAAPARPAEAGLASLDKLAASLKAAPGPRGPSQDKGASIEQLILQAVEAAPSAAGVKARLEPADAFRAAAAVHQSRLSALNAAVESKPASPLDLVGLVRELSAALDPALSVPAAVAQIVPPAPSQAKARGLAAAAAPADGALTQVMAAPSFATPMYKPLRDLHDMLLPGLEKTPPNTIALLKTNPRFIEAYMVGLNHEFARELLWREYPTDRRGSYFRQFWDVRGGGAARLDLAPMADWKDAEPLGSHLQGASGAAEEQLVLLIRGDLLRRYPGALIYAVKARPDGGFPSREAEEVSLPRFSGAREPEVSFVGFDLSEAEACATGAYAGTGGWYFVLQEQPTAPRFGLDPPQGPLPADKLEAWRYVSWGHLATTPDALKTLTYAPVGGALAGKSITEDAARITWGQNAGHMARIALQRAYRIAIHASALLAQPSA